MSLRFVSILGCATLTAMAMPAMAQMDHGGANPPPVCAVPATLPPALRSWTSPVAVTGATDMGRAALLIPGKAARIVLAPMAQVTFPAPSAKPTPPASFGGLASFTVDRASTWRVALGAAAWVDVVSGGKAAASVAHSHGPDCSGVRKMVDFPLTPGTYTLQIAGSRQRAITVLVTPLP